MSLQLNISEGTEEQYDRLYDEIGNPFTEDYYHRHVLKIPDMRFIIFEKDDEMVGGNVYMITRRFSPLKLREMVKIEGKLLGILPEYRGMGIGTAALYAREQWFRENHDADSIVISAMNYRAFDWFIREGYRPLGGHPLSKKLRKAFA